MEELQKLIQTLVNPQENYSNETKLQTKLLCDKIISDNAHNLEFFFRLIQTATDPYVKFWSISALYQLIHTSSLSQNMYTLYFNTIINYPSAVLTNTYIETKYGLLFVLLIKTHYPSLWPNAFNKLLELTHIKDQNIDMKVKIVGFVLTVLLEFDREIVEFNDNKTQEDFKKSKEIKEQMKKTDIANICYFLKEVIISGHILNSSSGEQLAIKALNVLEVFIPWINIESTLSLFPELIKLLENEVFQANSMRCVNALVSKGMEPLVKLELIEKNHILDLLSKVSPNATEDYLKEITSLMSKLGLFYLECATSHKELPPEIKANSQSIFFNIIQLAYQCFQTFPLDLTLSLIQLFNHYISSFRYTEYLEVHKISIDRLIEILIIRMQHTDTIIPSTEITTQIYKKEINSIIINILSIPLLQQQFILFVSKLITSLQTQYTQFTLTQKIIILYLFIKLGEHIKGILFFQSRFK